MNKILITGGCGYLGANVAAVLADSGFKVTILDIKLPEKNTTWIDKMQDIIIGDITDSNLLADLAKRDFDSIVHMISLDHFASQGAPELVLGINVLPTWSLLHHFKDKNLKTFIYFSTQQVLGKIPNESIDENRTPTPVNQYGLTHLLSEDIVAYYKTTTGINCINIRLSNGYGPPVFGSNNCWWLVVNDLCKTAFYEGKIVLQSDGSPQRDFIFVKDIGKAVRSIVENYSLYEQTVNIGYGETYTILELAHIVKKVYYSEFNRRIDIFLKDGTISESLPVYVQDKFTWRIDNLMKSGFKPEVRIEDGIREIFNYLKK